MRESEPVQPEKEKKFKSRIILNFFRHGEKEAHESGITHEEMMRRDPEIRLTDQGRVGAYEKGEGYRVPGVGIDQSVAFGSPRRRTKETAGLIMAGSLDEITGTESVEDLERILNKDKGLGLKLSTDKRLEAIMSDNQQYLNEVVRAHKDGRLLRWFVEESDKVAERVGDEEGATYNRVAARIAKIVRKYLEISPRFKKLVETKGYEDTMQRFFGTHEVISESFLAKVIEKTKGIDERNRFIRSLENKGFSFTEGYQMEILELVEGGLSLRVKFKKTAHEDHDEFVFDETIPIEIIDEIIRETKN